MEKTYKLIDSNYELLNTNNMTCKITTPHTSYTFNDENLDNLKLVFDLFKLDNKCISKIIDKDNTKQFVERIEDWLKSIIPEIQKEDIPKLGSAKVNILGVEVLLNIYRLDFHEFVYEISLLHNEIANLDYDQNITIEVF